MLNPVLQAFLMLFMVWLYNCVFKISPGERGVVARLGKVLPRLIPPGHTLVFWPVDTLYRIPDAEHAFDIPPQAVSRSFGPEQTMRARLRCRYTDPLTLVARIHGKKGALESFCQDRLAEAYRTVAAADLQDPKKLGERVLRLLNEHTSAWGIDFLAAEVHLESGEQAKDI
jgi:regulator of protease activity HflC (stomatin/prohibitin superfamily)